MPGAATRVRTPSMPARRSARKQPAQQRSRATVDVILQATARVLGRHGYAGTNTNLIAQTAGVSVGSIYQYFPNKEALVAALRDRHSRDMHALFQDVLVRKAHKRLDDGVAALVHALLAAHLDQAGVHAVLEGEFQFHDRNGDDASADQDIHRLLRGWLNRHRAETTVRNLDLAARVVLDTVVSLVHSAVIEPPPGAHATELEAEIVALVLGYLTVARRTPQRKIV
jgi:AcrR family transcriptional regulator